MQFLEEEILEITEATWQSMLGLAIYPHEVPESMDLSLGFLTGRIEISGAWNGVVLLHGSEELAQSAAAVIFTAGESSVTEQDQMDAIYELTNIIGGNIKSLLPEPCQLSLPTVAKTTPELVTVAHAERMSELVFDCQQQPLWVTVWKREGS